MQGEDHNSRDIQTAVERSDALLDMVRRLAVELHPQRKRTIQMTLDSALDRDLGFDSLCMANSYHAESGSENVRYNEVNHSSRILWGFCGDRLSMANYYNADKMA